MAISWGGFANGRLRVGIEVWTDGYDTWTPSINVYVAVYIETAGWNYNDAQSVTLSGAVGYTWNFQNTLGNYQTRHIGTYTIGGQGQSYGGGPDYYFHAQLNGAYDGSNAAHAVSFRLPPRPIRVPSPPGVPSYSSITATSAMVDFAGSGDHGGSGVDSYVFHLATDANFANVIRNQAGPSVATGLAPGTRYWARSYAHNAAGWSGASGSSSFVTSAFGTAAPTISGIGPDSATVNWTAPSGGTPTGYQVQWAKDVNFTSALQTYEGNTWATSRQLTALSPATKYWTRVRSRTSTGWGDWSAATTFDTLSGAKVRRNGAWVDAPVYARVGGQWVVAKVWKRVNGAWKV